MKKIFSNIFAAFMAITLISSCSEQQNPDQPVQGYLSLRVNTVTATTTKSDAPESYAPKQLYVEILNASGNIVKSTTDFDSDQAFASDIPLNIGEYTIVAHSNGWDGSGSGFDAPYYYGSQTVTVSADTKKTVEITCTQANVKVTVNFDQSFADAFTSATAEIASAIAGVTPRSISMGANSSSAYFPVGTLSSTISVVAKSGATYQQADLISDQVQPRDHYIINYALADPVNGTGSVNITVDGSGKTYTYNISVPVGGEVEAKIDGINAWSNFAYISADVTASGDYAASFTQDNLRLQYKKASATEWTSISNLALDQDMHLDCTLRSLSPATEYNLRIVYLDSEGEIIGESDTESFTTEAQETIYNGEFDYWRYTTGKVLWTTYYIYYPDEDGVTYWDSSNSGSASTMGSGTTQSTDTYYSSGNSAKIAANKMSIILAAGSLYTGQFGSTSGTSATLYWGVDISSRPTNLKGYYIYNPGSVDVTSSSVPTGAPAEGENDQKAIYWALTTSRFTVNNGDMTTFPDWKTNENVVAYGNIEDSDVTLTQVTGEDGNTWTEFNIPIKYNSLTTKPTTLIIVCASCKYGDYFHGSSSSVLYIDNLSFIYGDNPTMQN